MNAKYSVSSNNGRWCPFQFTTLKPNTEQRTWIQVSTWQSKNFQLVKEGTKFRFLLTSHPKLSNTTQTIQEIRHNHITRYVFFII